MARMNFTDGIPQKASSHAEKDLFNPLRKEDGAFFPAGKIFCAAFL